MEVNIVDKYSYVVVQFLQIPYTDIGNYTCVPYSWIRIRRRTDRKSMVAYPDESPSITNMRIINCDQPSKNWNLYMAIIKHETYSYEDAYEFIMGKLRNASTNSASKNSAVMRTDYKLVPATATKIYSPVLKSTNLSESPLTKNKNKLKIVDKERLGDTISNSSKLLHHSNVESTIPTSSELLSPVFLESIMMMETDGRKYQDQITQSINTLFGIQNPINEANQSSQMEIPKSSPVNQYHPQVSSTQKTPGKSSEVKCAIPKPNFYSEMTNASYASVWSSNSAECQDLSIEEMFVDEISKVSCAEQSILFERRAENESSIVPNSIENANYSGQSAVISMGEGQSMNDVSSTQYVDNDERSNFPEISSERILTASPDSNEQLDQSVDSLLKKAHVSDQLFEFFQIMEDHFSQTCQFAHDLQESLVQSHGVIKCLASKSEITGVMSKEVSVEVQRMAKENQAEKKGEENSDGNMEEYKKKDNVEDSKTCKNDDYESSSSSSSSDDDDDDDKEEDSEDKVLKTTRGHIRTFLLPLEYDPDDTRWTLKYRENDPELNLVELVPQSNVFIDSIKLAHCKQVSKNSKALARMLLVEIFSQIALSVCSLTGARAYAFDMSGTNVRPGLDESARKAILSFVEEHAQKNKWGFDSRSVINSLRSKIQDFRAKHGKTA